MTKAMTKRAHAPRHRGMILVTALVLLAVLTLVAVVAMRMTTLDMRMTTNTMLKARAFQSSEGARVQVAEPLDEHVFNQGWSVDDGGDKPVAGFTPLPDGLEVIDGTANVYDLVEGVKTPVMRYRLDGDGNDEIDDTSPAPADMSADIAVTSLGASLAVGASTAMISGYEGLGKGAAGGGSYLVFDVESRGYAANRTIATTGSDTRITIRN